MRSALLSVLPIYYQWSWHRMAEGLRPGWGHLAEPKHSDEVIRVVRQALCARVFDSSHRESSQFHSVEALAIEHSAPIRCTSRAHPWPDACGCWFGMPPGVRVASGCACHVSGKRRVCNLQALEHAGYHLKLRMLRDLPCSYTHETSCS